MREKKHMTLDFDGRRECVEPLIEALKTLVKEKILSAESEGLVLYVNIGEKKVHTNESYQLKPKDRCGLRKCVNNREEKFIIVNSITLSKSFYKCKFSSIEEAEKEVKRLLSSEIKWSDISPKFYVCEVVKIIDTEK